ncbi:hypothetical protein C6341_g5601 [Phytophthora cactorum]|nr:hypothetical protein C6341_g5601 [Phytophthora cactorum]
MLPPLPTRLYWQCCSGCWCSPGALYTDQTGEFDWSAGNFGCSVGRDLRSGVARGTARTVNVASDDRSRCLNPSQRVLRDSACCWFEEPDREILSRTHNIAKTE